MLDSGVNRPVRVDTRMLPSAQARTTPAMQDLHNLPQVEMGAGMLIQASDLQYVKFEGSAPADWSISSAFHDTGSLKPEKKEQFTLLLDSTQMGGIVLSVGVVWWASRVTGVIGSLMASIPAWRQLDPLPVVERDEDTDQVDWQSADDRVTHADELAISIMLEGPRQFALTGA
jgi:hypothetical protein